MTVATLGRVTETRRTRRTRSQVTRSLEASHVAARSTCLATTRRGPLITLFPFTKVCAIMKPRLIWSIIVLTSSRRMITHDTLYTLANSLGCLAMLSVVAYHFIAVNKKHLSKNAE